MAKYDFVKIEKKWRKHWEKEKTNEVDLDKAKNPYYNLMMFPYPSAEGLHVGNMYAFTHSDAYGRFIRKKGFNVFEPIGLDGFGIHSENYAIKIKEHIKDVSKRTEKHFYEQLRLIGNQYDWSRTVETYKPEYYKWTQWLFLQMYKKDLAYRAKAPVNWCSSCKTVLADEQVIGGECERCGTETQKRQMEQWFFKITAYADRLLKNLETIDWPDDVKLGQHNWIGKSTGASVKFKVQSLKFKVDYELEVFTTRPDTLFGATFMVVCPEHELIGKLKDRITNFAEVEKYIKQAQKKSALERTDLNKDKTGVELKGIKAINPVNKKEIPIFAADYVLADYGTGAIMAVPAHDQRDFEFAKKYKNKNNLSIKCVIKPPLSWFEDKVYEKEPGYSEINQNKEKNRESARSLYSINPELIDSAYGGEGILINSDNFNGLTSEEARQKIVAWLEKNKLGCGSTNYKLRDWCVSRQRYWGPPIPMIYCAKDGWHPVPEIDLPVLLPEMEDFLPDGSGKGPLNKNKDFVNTTCPKCGGPARRETDVSDPFVDSCWYFLRYPSADFDDRPFDQERTKKWLPVDMYIGGKEHTVLHLLYSRFVTMVLHDLGYLEFEEPFKRFFAHGLLIKDGAKISKSKGNVVNPDKYVAKFGADSVRLYLMFLGDVRLGGDWRDTGMGGMFRFVNRVWVIAEKIIKKESAKKTDVEVLKFAHKTIKRVGGDLEKLKFNTAIAAIMEYVNELYIAQAAKKEIGTDAIAILAHLISPFAPFIAEELWSSFAPHCGASEDKSHRGKSIFDEPWPQYDLALVKENTIELVIQINGKVRGRFAALADISEEAARKLALADDNIKKWLEGKNPKKVIFVKGRLMNIVI